MLNNREGKPVPEVTFHIRRGHEWMDVTSKELFAGKKVVVFALPGAFTPTCSSSHVPRYNQLARVMRTHGVDDIICLSVNDAFVMSEWQRHQHADELTFIADGSGKFTSGMGMLVDKDDVGFGKRSWRYSMLVDNGIIAKMFIEPERPGDPFEVSDADTMLSYIAPNSPRPSDVTVLAREGCEYCAKAERLLDESGLGFETLLLNRDFTDRSLRALSGAAIYPQVFVDGVLIGGSEALERWLASRQAA